MTVGTHEENQEFEFDAQTVSDLQNQNAALIGAHNEERDLVNQLLGQAQMADAFGKFSQTVWASKLAYVKENKLYKAIAGKKTPNGLVFSGTWAEFCSLLGVSDEKANQDIANLRAFGEEAMDSMSKMGIGYREMRQFRRLPEDEKSALIEVAKTGDKDGFLDLAEEIIARHAKQTEQLTQQRDDALADNEAMQEVVADKSNKIDELERNLKRIQKLPPDEVSKELRDEATGICFDAESSLRGSVLIALQAVRDHAEQHNIDVNNLIRGQLDQLNEAVDYLREQLDIPAWGGSSEPVWSGEDIPADSGALQ